MSTPVGRRRWAIAEGWIPSKSTGEGRELVSHETACLLNAGDVDAHVELTIYFTDREPAGPYRATVPARRTLHLRFNDLTDPEPVPLDTDYASVIVSDQPIVVQHTRLDSRQAENAVMTTMAFPLDDLELRRHTSSFSVMSSLAGMEKKSPATQKGEKPDRVGGCMKSAVSDPSSLRRLAACGVLLMAGFHVACSSEPSSSAEAAAGGGSAVGSGQGGATSAGGGDDSDGAGGGDATDGSGGAGASDCITDVPCSSDTQCVALAGTSCNTGLPAPRCQTVQCGPFGSPCSHAGHCEVGMVCDDGLCGDPLAQAVGECLEGCLQADRFDHVQSDGTPCSEETVRSTCEALCADFPASGSWGSCAGELADPDSWGEFEHLVCAGYEGSPYICIARVYCFGAGGDGVAGTFVDLSLNGGCPYDPGWSPPG
jgi:hypothetical protein